MHVALYRLRNADNFMSSQFSYRDRLEAGDPTTFCHVISLHDSVAVLITLVCYHNNPQLYLACLVFFQLVLTVCRLNNYSRYLSNDNYFTIPGVYVPTVISYNFVAVLTM